MNLRYLKIGLSYFAFFLLCLAVMWKLRNPDGSSGVAADSAQVTPTLLAARGATTQLQRSTRPDVALAANPPPSLATAQNSPPSPPASAAAGAGPGPGAEDLPISLQFRHRPDLGKIQGSVMNKSGTELVIDATLYDPNTKETSKVQLDVAPYTAKPFGVDDGLDMQSGDRVTLQSAPYRDQVTQIP